jgi:hypothetical protein
MKNLLISTALILATAPALHADNFEAAMKAFVENNVVSWASDPTLVDAINAQNLETSAYNAAKIEELDQIWRSFGGAKEADIVANVISNPAADFLRTHAANSNGAITEVFIMDAKGLNVAASDVTSDYWQGDEEKFTQTYPMGNTAMHFGDVELDESTQEVQGQVSITLVDEATGEAIGAMTIGINLAALM